MNLTQILGIGYIVGVIIYTAIVTFFMEEDHEVYEPKVMEHEQRECFIFWSKVLVALFWPLIFLRTVYVLVRYRRLVIY